MSPPRYTSILFLQVEDRFTSYVSPATMEFERRSNLSPNISIFLSPGLTNVTHKACHTSRRIFMRRCEESTRTHTREYVKYAAFYNFLLRQSFYNAFNPMFIAQCRKERTSVGNVRTWLLLAKFVDFLPPYCPLYANVYRTCCIAHIFTYWCTSLFASSSFYIMYDFRVQNHEFLTRKWTCE